VFLSLWSQSKTKFNAFIQAGSVLKNYAHILELLLRLRQACNHPYLVLHARQPAASSAEAPQLMMRYLAELRAGHQVVPPPALRELLTRWADEECVICLEPVDEPALTPCAHVFCKACILRHLLASPGTSCCPTCNQQVLPNDLIPLPKPDKDNMPADPAASAEGNNHKAALAAKWKSSTKIDALMQSLCDLLARDPGIKSIVFSQWTSMVRSFVLSFVLRSFLMTWPFVFLRCVFHSFSLRCSWTWWRFPYRRRASASCAWTAACRRPTARTTSARSARTRA